MKKPLETQITVIGAGVIGCAIAHEFSKSGYPVMVLEQGPRIAEGITSRNSGVIHAGIYYPPNSLKAQACIRGKNLLYEWCEKYQVPYKKIGKWIVGSRAEEAELSSLYENATRSGATGLSYANNQQLSELQAKNIKAEVALFSAETGIIDPYTFSRSLQIQAEAYGAVFVMNSTVSGIQRLNSGSYQIETERGHLETEVIINAAGLFADDINRMIGNSSYTIYPYRGDYFSLQTKLNFESLIYPVKKKKAAGLGIHLTVGLDGSYRLGPDVQAVSDKHDFSPPSDILTKQKDFYEAASKYLLGIQLEDLRYDFCGLRPKLRSPKDKEEKDFIIEQIEPGFISLLGIESPGLTASLAIAKNVVALLR